MKGSSRPDFFDVVGEEEDLAGNGLHFGGDVGEFAADDDFFSQVVSDVGEGVQEIGVAVQEDQGVVEVLLGVLDRQGGDRDVHALFYPDLLSAVVAGLHFLVLDHDFQLGAFDRPDEAVEAPHVVGFHRGDVVAALDPPELLFDQVLQLQDVDRAGGFLGPDEESGVDDQANAFIGHYGSFWFS